MAAFSTLAGIAILLAAAHTAAAQTPMQPAVECPEGMMPAPQPPQTGMGSMPSLNPTSIVTAAAKKKLLGSKSSTSKPDSVVPAKPACLTPEQYVAEAKAQQTAAIKGAATAAISATPIGMAVVGAKAAAPYAGKAAGAISNRFRRGPNKESMSKALATGRLEVENVSFDAGADSPNAGSSKSLAILADVLKSAEGKFIVRVSPESNGVAAADPKLALLRAQLVTASLVAAGVPSTKISAAPLTIVSSWDTGAPKKTEAHLEILAVVAPTAAESKK